MTSFDSTFTNHSDNNNNSLRKKIVVGGAIALLLGIASYSSNGSSARMGVRKNLLRSNQGTDTDLGFGCSAVTNAAQSAIAELHEQITLLDDPLVLDQDYVWSKKDTVLDKTGCKGDITITVAKGASVEGLSQGTLELNQQSCSFSLFQTKITGVWELSASNPGFELDATVTTQATNCDIDKSASITITVVGPTASATAGLTVNANLITPSAIFEKVSLKDVEVGFGSAVIDVVPGGQHHYGADEAAVITEMINDNVVPAVNGFFSDRLPTTVTGDDLSTPEKAQAWLEKFIKN